MSRPHGDCLAPEDIATLRAAVENGERPTVYFTGAAVGVQGVRSGKVVAVGDVAEDDFVQVKPAGQDDVLSFSPGELTLSKPRQGARRPTGGSRAGGPGTTKAHSPESRQNDETAPAADSGPRSKQATARLPARTSRQAAATATSPKVTITISSDEQGGWRVEVLVGRRKPVRGLAVSAGAVAKAASALSPDVAEAIDAALAAAREQQRVTVERLRGELAAAERTLDELG
jgi:hypothetical protein